jgi:hypothetical protein
MKNAKDRRYLVINMVCNRTKIKMLFIFMLCLLSLPNILHAEVEWSFKQQLNLNASPLDIAQSGDGQTAFILTPGAVLVYSMQDNKLTESIPVDKGFDRLLYSEKNNYLMLTSSSEKNLKIIKVDTKLNIAVSGLPFKGPENALVTIAVFSDYQ